MRMIDPEVYALGADDAALIYRAASNSYDIVFPEATNAGEVDLTIGFLALIFAYFALNSDGGQESAGKAALKMIGGGKPLSELDG